MDLMQFYDDELIEIMEQMARATDMATAAYHAKDENNFEIALGALMILQTKVRAKMFMKGVPV
jgi:hypothetical protein